MLTQLLAHEHLLLWLLTFGSVCLAAQRLDFKSFWHRWEFVAAASSALFSSVVFAVLYYLPPPGERPLFSFIHTGGVHLLIHFFRFVLPVVMLVLVSVFVTLERTHAEPLPTAAVSRKLILTAVAFLSFAIGDYVVLDALIEGFDARALVGLRGDWPLWSSLSPPSANWSREFAGLLYYVDLPFLGSFSVLVVYWLKWLKPCIQQSEAQAFLGGAAALEVLVQSLAHAATTSNMLH